MKRVIIVGLLCVVVVAQGCSANRGIVTHRRGVVHQPTCPHSNYTQAPGPQIVESEEFKIRRIEAISAAVLVAGEVACAVLRVIR